MRASIDLLGRADPRTRVVAAVAGLAVISAAGVFVARATSGGSHEPDWILISADDDLEVSVDRTMVVRNGSTVFSWLVYLPRDPGKSPSGRPYAAQLHARIDDCAADTFATEVVMYRQSDGSSVDETRSEGAALHFAKNVAGSREARISAAVCALGKDAPALEPSIVLDKATAGAWRSVSTERHLGRELRISALTTSTRRNGDFASIVARTDYAPSNMLPDGRGYRQVFDALRFHCDTKVYTVASTDYYNASGMLVAVTRYPGGSKPMRGEQPGDLMDQLADIACGKPAPAPRS